MMHDMENRLFRPSTHKREAGVFKVARLDFFRGIPPPFTRKRRFRAPETQVSQKGPPGRSFKVARLDFLVSIPPKFKH